jgi:hypothetical protein
MRRKAMAAVVVVVAAAAAAAVVVRWGLEANKEAARGSDGDRRQRRA